MVELSPGTRGYVYPRSIDFINNNNKNKNYTKAARALIEVFFTGEQLLQLTTMKNAFSFLFKVSPYHGKLFYPKFDIRTDVPFNLDAFQNN